MGKFKEVLQHHPNSSNFEYQYMQSCHVSKKLHQSMMIDRSLYTDSTVYCNNKK